MARYIDADALQRRICGAKCGCEYEDCGCEGDCAFDHFISHAPTADVAPRAEVARDIVEFLFRRSESLQHLFKDNPDSAQCFRGRFELENAAIIIANEYGVDLTKEEAEKALAERIRE